MASVGDFFVGLYNAIKEIFTNFIGNTNSIFNSVTNFIEGLFKGKEEE